VSSQGIFLSYRRADAAPYVRLLQYQLSDHFPNVRVFMDLDSIEPGLEFAEVIRRAVETCVLLVVLIGRQWLTLTDEQGRHRLDDPDDYVRFEVQTALERGVRVIPVLIDGASPLRPEQLPAELRKLARLNALELSYSRYEYDSDRLLDLIRRVLAAAPDAGIKPTANADAFAGPHDIRPNDTAHNQQAQQDPEVNQKDRPPFNRLLLDAKRAAEAIARSDSKAKALAAIAGALATTDPDRAAQMITDAEQIAQSMPDGQWKASALAAVAKALTAADPSRAAQIMTDAEHMAQSVPDENARASTLAEIVVMLAGADPDRAERIAQSIADIYWRAWALAQIVMVAAAAAPDRAERIARSITGVYLRAWALAAVAGALGVTDPDRAAWLMADAEGTAQPLTDNVLKASARAAFARALATTDPGRAAQAMTDADRIARSIFDKKRRAQALASVSWAMAVINPDHAVKLANYISDIDAREKALTDIATALAGTEPDRAEGIARSIKDGLRQVEILVAIVEADRNPAGLLSRLTELTSANSPADHPPATAAPRVTCARETQPMNVPS
jgi:TIR domain